MSTWTEDELNRIESADELQIAPVRRTGASRARTTIWVVRAGDDFYVRAAYGPRAAGTAPPAPAAKRRSGPAASRRT
jgi:hypothetical protein